MSGVESWFRIGIRVESQVKCRELGLGSESGPSLSLRSVFRGRGQVFELGFSLEVRGWVSSWGRIGSGLGSNFMSYVSSHILGLVSGQGWGRVSGAGVMSSVRVGVGWRSG